jgi:hypothetical protein
MVTLGSLLLIGLMMAVGYLRGVARLGVAFMVLVVSSLLAKPLHVLTAWLVIMVGVPKLLVPLAATLTTGITLFVVLLVPSMIWLKRKMAQVEERPSWDQPLGAVAGGVWGLTLTLLTLVGLTTVARLDRAMRVGAAESEIRAEARRKFEREADQELRPLASTMSPRKLAAEKLELVKEAEERFFVDPAVLRERTAQSPLDTFLVDLEHSPFDGVVDKVSPVKANTERILRDLTIVVGDPLLLTRFRSHPTVRTLMEDPTVQVLSGDKEVSRLVIEGRYRELLDHPRLVEAVENQSLRARFADVDMGKILDEVRGTSGRH